MVKLYFSRVPRLPTPAILCVYSCIHVFIFPSFMLFYFITHTHTPTPTPTPTHTHTHTPTHTPTPMIYRAHRIGRIIMIRLFSSAVDLPLWKIKFKYISFLDLTILFYMLAGSRFCVLAGLFPALGVGDLCFCLVVFSIWVWNVESRLGWAMFCIKSFYETILSK